MNGTNPPGARIAVVGGGITGLAAAYRLSTLRPDLCVELFEGADRLGGVLRSWREHGYLLERAADNFLRGPSAPWAEQLCREIGFADQLIPTNDEHRGAHVFWNGRLHEIPAGFQLLAPTRLWPILTSRLLSPLGRLRLCLEPLIPERPRVSDESLTEFAERRLGREAFERLVQPLVSGIYTADPNRLSVAAALPHMMQLVRAHGSLYRAMRRQRKHSAARATQPVRGARYSLFVAPRDGMSSLIDALTERLSRTILHRQVRVQRIARGDDGQWDLTLEGSQPGRTETFRAVILAVPTWAAAPMLAGLDDGQLARELSAIEYADSAVVFLGYQNKQVERPLDAFGCVVPAAAGRKVLAISYASVKYPQRAPEGRVLLRVFVGGALQGHLASLPDDELTELVRNELAVILRVNGEPELCRVVRWPRAMPQYHVGHLDRVQRINERLRDWAGLYVASNGLSGVGIPYCVRSGTLAAEQVVQELDRQAACEPQGRL